MANTKHHESTTAHTYLTLPEAAAIARVCTQTLVRRIRDGKLKAAKPGREWRIRRDWLDEHLAWLSEFQAPDAEAISAMVDDIIAGD